MGLGENGGAGGSAAPAPNRPGWRSRRAQAGRFGLGSGLQPLENVLGGGMRLLGGPGCGFGGAHRGASLIGQCFVVAGGMGEPLGYARGGLCGAACGGLPAF